MHIVLILTLFISFYGLLDYFAFNCGIDYIQVAHMDNTTKPKKVYKGKKKKKKATAPEADDLSKS